MRIQGIIGEDGNIYTTIPLDMEAVDMETVELTENITWESSDYTDENGQNWIRVDRLLDLFNGMVKATGMKKAALAAICGKTPQTFSTYCTGKNPIPALVWREVERLASRK
jgi:hypothetical protein